MIIDSHNHPNYLGYTTEKILADMEQNKIDRTWLLTLETPEHEHSPAYYRLTRGNECGPIPFSSCLESWKQAPDKFVLAYAPDPRDPHAIDKLEAAIDLYNVRVCGEIMLRMMYDNWDAISLFKFCGKKGMPVIVEVNYGAGSDGRFPNRPGYWYGGGIEAYERAVSQCPDTNFLGHGPGFWAHISADDGYQGSDYPQGGIVPGGKVVQMMRQYPNLFCDLSAFSGLNALKRDLVFTKEFLDEFQDRILYGRDQYDNHLQEFLNSLELPKSVLEKIYAGNSLRLVP